MLFEPNPELNLLDIAVSHYRTFLPLTVNSFEHIQIAHTLEEHGYVTLTRDDDSYTVIPTDSGFEARDELIADDFV